MSIKSYRKSVVAGAVPLVVAFAMWRLTGNLNTPEFALALTGFLNAVAVYETPNAGPEEGR